jgi:hypothetical protein
MLYQVHVGFELATLVEMGTELSKWKKCQSSIIFYYKIPILCRSLAKSAHILLVMTKEFRELLSVSPCPPFNCWKKGIHYRDKWNPVLRISAHTQFCEPWTLSFSKVSSISNYFYIIAGLFAKALESVNVKELITNISSGVGAAPATGAHLH